MRLNISNVAGILSGVALSLTLVASANASNPFKRPEVKIVEQPIYTEDAVTSVENPYAADFSLEEPTSTPASVGNPLLQKESVVFRGSINGVDIYFDKLTGQYIHDEKELEKVELLSSSLPDLEKVNY